MTTGWFGSDAREEHWCFTVLQNGINHDGQKKRIMAARMLIAQSTTLIGSTAQWPACKATTHVFES
jgi:hypothetical protein